jgi:phosphoribosylformylglycinamidine synthase
VYRTYDHTIGTNTVLQPGEADAAVLRIKGTRKGIALTTDCNSRYCYLDPYRGGVHAVAEAARNLSCVGAEPLAVTDCLNFGNPERPEVFWQMEQAVQGMADVCEALGVPVVSGNVSLYNETEGVAVLPTPMVGMLGLLEDVEKRAGLALRQGMVIGLLVGSRRSGVGSRESDGAALLGASEYVESCFGVKVGQPPALYLEDEMAVQNACRTAIREGVLDVAHDCGDGGLAVAIAEMCIAGGIGADVRLDGGGARSDVLLFGEGGSRIVVGVQPDRLTRLQEIAESVGAYVARLGMASGDGLRIVRYSGRGDDMREEVVIEVAVGEMESAWRGGMG